MGVAPKKTTIEIADVSESGVRVLARHQATGQAQNACPVARSRRARFIGIQSRRTKRTSIPRRKKTRGREYSRRFPKMIFRVCKTVELNYSAPVFHGIRRLRVAPPEIRGTQSVKSFDWNCDPAPDFAREFSDEFGNRVLELRHEKIENHLRFEAQIEARTDGEDFVAPHAIGLPQSGIGAFLLPSKLCDANPEMRVLATRWKEIEDEKTRAEEINDFVFQTLQYAPNATHLATRASQLLQSPRGVCQDYAHLLIALCRLSRLPARYIGGYLEGEGAMHAWAEVLCGGRWLAFDPTHGERATRGLAVATGRDYRDAAPHDGQYRGRATATYESRCVVRCEN